MRLDETDTHRVSHGASGAMEMHQIRYFLAVAQTLNFTRAAEQCNVSQPALTRAIQQLEDELAGPLLRREGKLSHLTELGQRMLPLMRQCYDCAVSAKTLATSMKKGADVHLSLTLSQTIDIGLISDPLAEVQRAFPRLQLAIARADPAGIAERLKKGEAELAIAGPLDHTWDRLDSFALFKDAMGLVVGPGHPLANRKTIAAEDVAEFPILINPVCESAEHIAQCLARLRIDARRGHQIQSQCDLIRLLETGLGVGILPLSELRRGTLQQLQIEGLDLSHQVSLYCVAGRPRSVVADALFKLLRARNWAQAIR